MKQSIVAASMALSAALSAQAQAPKAPVVCTENQTNVVSMVEGVIGCKDITPKKAYTHTSAPTVALGGETTQETSDNMRSNAAIEKNAQLELTGVRDNHYGNGAEVTIGVGGADLAGGLMLQKLENAKQALMAVSNKINSNLAISAGIGTRSESAQVGLGDSSLNSTDLSAENIFFRIDAKFLESLGLNRAAITYIHTKVGSNTVKDETLAWTEESVIDTPTLTRYITEYYEQHRTVQFRGLDTNKLLANAVFYIGKNGEVTLQLGVMERDGQGTTGVVGATGKYYTSIGGIPVVPYLGGGKSITGNQNHQNIGVRAALSEHISVGLERSQYSGSLGKQSDTRASVMFSLQPNTSQFVRADVSAPLNASSIVTEILRSPEYRIGSVAGQGKIEEIVTTPKKMSQSVRDVAKEVKEKPTPKPTPEPEPIDPEAPVITLAGASTMTLTVGDTWTDPGATCVDNKDTACTVVVSGNVDMSTVGTYTITYTATDSAGNESTKEREVEVVAVADPAPVVGGAFASLSDMTVSDNAGGFNPNVLNAGGVTDSLGRTVVYSATGLPPGLSIDSSTGVISGTYDVFGSDQSFTITVKAQAVGSTKSATRQFTLTIRDDG